MIYGVKLYNTIETDTINFKLFNISKVTYYKYYIDTKI